MPLIVAGILRLRPQGLGVDVDCEGFGRHPGREATSRTIGVDKSDNPNSDLGFS